MYQSHLHFPLVKHQKFLWKLFNSNSQWCQSSLKQVELQLFVNRNTIRHVQWTSYHHFQAALGEARPTDAQYISSGPLPPLATVRVCAYVCACAHLCVSFAWLYLSSANSGTQDPREPLWGLHVWVLLKLGCNLLQGVQQLQDYC